MGIPELVKTVKSIKTIKTGNVVKLTKEVRKPVPDANTIKKSYYLNKASQVNKLITKNKNSAPIKSEYKTNSVYITYSPSVFKEAVNKVTDDMHKGDCYETNKLDIKVIETRPETDANGILVTTLITLEVKAIGKFEAPVLQQIHVYYTKQALMIQGHRKISGIKGYKILFEDFLQPSVELEIEENKDNINNTKHILHKADANMKANTFKNMSEEPKKKKTFKNLNFECDQCEGNFVTKERLEDHIQNIHKHNIYKCTICLITFDNNDLLKKHLDSYHALIPMQVTKEFSFKLSEAGSLQLKKTHENKKKVACNLCEIEVQNRTELKTHMTSEHEETILMNDAQAVIKKVKEIMNVKFKDVEKEYEKDNIKRSNSTSPGGPKAKTLRESNSPNQEHKTSKPSKDKYSNKMLEIEEDLKNAQNECKSLISENETLKVKLINKENEANKALQAVVEVEPLIKSMEEMEDVLKVSNEERHQLKAENKELKKQLEQQEKEVGKAMEAITNEIKEETIKINKKFREEVESVKGANQKQIIALKKLHEKELNVIKQEKDKILEDMTKMQNESEITNEKVKSIENKKKIKRNIKIFNALVENGHDLPVEIKESDECIEVNSCEGNCDKVSELTRLNSFKQSGSIRRCPQTQPDDKPFFKCNKCDFMTQNKEYFNTHMEQHKNKVFECPQCGIKSENKLQFEKHMKQVHGNFPYCKICYVGFWSQDAAKKHVSLYHNTLKKTDANNSDHNVAEETNQTKSHIEQSKGYRRPCHYVGTRNGCKKGDRCNFDHSAEAQAKSVVKVPKLCNAKEACVRKPRCKYVHLEDGETLPERNGSSGHRQGMVRQDFGPRDFSQQPPGWSSIPPPTPAPTSPPPPPTPPPSSVQEELTRRNNVIQEFLRIMVPNLMSMTEFPSLQATRTNQRT